jgi:hypothetical protein
MAFSTRKAFVGLSVWTVAIAGAAQTTEVWRETLGALLVVVGVAASTVAAIT